MRALQTSFWDNPAVVSKPTSKLTSAQVELVLKRAAELEANKRAHHDDAMDASDVERLGQEVGLSPHAISQALTELDRGHLEPRKVDALQRVLGDPFVSVQRWVPQPPAHVEKALTSFMNEQLMVVDRNHGERVEWIQAAGLFAGLARSVRFADRYSFGPASRIETVVVPEDEGSSVSFRIEMGAARKQGTSAVALRGLALSGAGALVSQGFGDAVVALVCLAASGMGLGLLLWSERERFAQLRERAVLAPERFLDALAALDRTRRIGASDAGLSAHVAQQPAKVEGS